MLLTWLFALVVGLGTDYADLTQVILDDPDTVEALDDGTPQPPPKR